MFIREKKILKYIYIYTSVCTYIQQTRSNALSSLSLALAPRIFCRSDGRRRRPPRALSFTLLFALSRSSFFFSDEFRVLKSKALSRHVSPPLSSVFLRGEPILLYFSRATRTHARTHKTKKNAIHDRPKSLRVRARPENDETGEKERFKSLFLVGTEKGREGIIFSPD